MPTGFESAVLFQAGKYPRHPALTLKLLFFGIVIPMGARTLGLLATAVLKQQAYYARLSHMNFVRSDRVNRVLT